MTFEDELKELRVLHASARKFTRERRDWAWRQVQDALNREEQKVDRLPLRSVEHIELTTPPDAA